MDWKVEVVKHLNKEGNALKIEKGDNRNNKVQLSLQKRNKIWTEYGTIILTSFAKQKRQELLIHTSLPCWPYCSSLVFF